jgi:hypothetical protein
VVRTEEPKGRHAQRAAVTTTPHAQLLHTRSQAGQLLIGDRLLGLLRLGLGLRLGLRLHAEQQHGRRRLHPSAPGAIVFFSSQFGIAPASTARAKDLIDWINRLITSGDTHVPDMMLPHGA